MKNELIIYHGSPHVINKPTFGKGNKIMITVRAFIVPKT